MDLLLRRRAMMAQSTGGGDTPGADGKIWAYYDVTTTTSPISLLYTTTGFSGMEVDGVSVTLAKTYTFGTTGEHLVKFIPSISTTSIAQNQFYQIAGLKKIVTPSQITSIGQRAFFGCSGLTTIDFPSVQYINYQCFNNDNSLTGELNLPSLMEFSPEGSQGAEFYNTGITSIKSLGSIPTVFNQAFSSCTHLTSIDLPDTLQSLMQWAFLNCTALITVTCHATTPPTYDRAFQGCSALTAIYVPAASVADYQAASGWSAYASIIQAIP